MHIFIAHFTEILWTIFLQVKYVEYRFSESVYLSELQFSHLLN